MRKIYKSILGLAVLLTGVNVNAQVSAYSFTQLSCTYSPIPYAGPSATAIANGTFDDNVFSNVPIGFNFTYNNTSYTSIGLNVNGWINMGTVTPGSSYNPISTGTASNVISFFGRDLQLAPAQSCTTTLASNTVVLTFTPAASNAFAIGDTIIGAGIPLNTTITAISGNSITMSNTATAAGTNAYAKGTISYNLTGTSPNQVFTIQWRRVGRFSQTSSGLNDYFNAQIKLYQTTNVIEVIYGNCGTSNAISSNGQIGLRGVVNSDFNNRSILTGNSYSTSLAGLANNESGIFNSTVTIPSGQIYRWTPPPACAGAPAANSAVASNTGICVNGSSNLSLATTYTVGGLSYQWLSATTASTGPYSAITNATLSSFAATAIGVSTWYQCVVTCTNGPASATTTPVLVNVSAVPTVSLGVIAPVCVGQSIALTCSTNIGTNFVWTGPASFTSTLQNPTIISAPSNGTGNYNVLVSVAGCSATSVSVPVTVNSTNLGIASSPQVICGSGSSTLTAVGNATAVTWNTSATTTSIIVTPTTTTVYTVTGTGTINCLATAVVTVSVLNPTITGIGATACSPTAVATLSANAFAPVNWYATPTPTNALASGNTFTAIAATTTTYYAQAQSSSNNTLLTTLVGGNGNTGTMFDVVAQSNIVVNGFDVHLNGTLTTTIEVWYRTGSYVGFNTSNVGWTNLITTTVVGLGTGVLTPVPLTFSLPIAATQTVAFFVTPNGGSGFNYTNGTVASLLASDANAQIFVGNAGGYFSSTISGRSFNGRMKYSVPGCTSPIIPVVLTSATIPTVSAVSNASLICNGQTASLTASGASTYSWNTSATTSVVAVSPSVTTSYTVTGTSNGCSNSATITQSVSACTGLNNNVASTIGTVVYPNPNTGLFTIELNNGSVKTIEVMDLTGRIVLTNTSSNDKIDFNISNLANGVYFVKVQSNNSVEVIKIVKQ